MESGKSRKLAEAEHHNRRERDRNQLSKIDFEKKYSNKRFYKIARQTASFIRSRFEEECDGKKVLDYCCGTGNTSLELAECGAKVYGVDISEESVRSSQLLLEKAGYPDAQFVVGDAEQTKFSDNFFDVIVIMGALHHLKIKSAFAELSRILKPGGKIIALEALGYNPVIQWYRNRTPELRTAWEKDHILKHKDLKLARHYFSRVEVRYFQLATLATIPAIDRSIFPKVLSLAEALDGILLKIPLLRLMAWQMVIEFSVPLKE